ncbi:GIY-YIG nuclease family protein [Azospirillum doebereinerae]
MMGEERRAAVAAYKEREVSAGVYAVRCAATGQVWVGTAPDVDSIRNRIWFQLRMATSPHRDLQGAWTAHGADSLAFEVLERLDEEPLAYARTAALKARLAHWSAALDAPVLAVR